MNKFRTIFHFRENNYKEEEIKNDDSEINIASMSDPGDDESIGKKEALKI